MDVSQAGGDRLQLPADLLGRLLFRRYPDATSVGFTYSATGRRLTATDARGTTGYGYDERDRLTAITYPGGRKLEFEHDAGGNRTKLTAVLTALSLVTNYTFDDLSRLQDVEDAAGRILVQRTKPVQPTESGLVVLRLARQIGLLVAASGICLLLGSALSPLMLRVLPSRAVLLLMVLALGGVSAAAQPEVVHQRRAEGRLGGQQLDRVKRRWAPRWWHCPIDYV